MTNQEAAVRPTVSPDGGFLLIEPIGVPAALLGAALDDIAERCADAGLTAARTDHPGSRPQLAIEYDGASAVAETVRAASASHDATCTLDALIDVLLPPGPRPRGFPAYPEPVDRFAEPPGGRVVPYGPHPDQFAEWWPPPAQARDVPVAVLVHGGYWRRRWRLDVMNAMAVDLHRRGYAVWNLEYRRLGTPEACWPGMFEDVQAGYAALAATSEAHQLDLTSVTVIGHSAGGHLALCLAAGDAEPRPALTIALAAVTDLEEAHELGLSNGAVRRLLGRNPPAAADAAIWRDCSPVRMLPSSAPRILLHGNSDDSVPVSFTLRYGRLSAASADPCEVRVLPEADHFAFIDPASAAWPTVLAALESRNAHLATGA